MIAYNYPTLRPRGSGDRASASGAEGRRFESYRGRHLIVSFGRVGGWLTLKPSRPPVLFPCFSWDQDLAVRNLWSLCFSGPCSECLGLVVLRRRAASPSFSLVLPALPCIGAPSTHILDPNRDELILSCIGGPPCWKRGGEFGQIDDNRWSAIRQGRRASVAQFSDLGFCRSVFLIASRMPEDGPICALRPPIIVRLPEFGGVFATTAPSVNPLCCASLCLPRLTARNSSPRVPPRSAIVNNFAIFLNVGGCLLKSSSVCTFYLSV